VRAFIELSGEHPTLPRAEALAALASERVEVRISNEEAIRFYKRYGFDVAAVLPKFYTDGEDGFKMVKHF